MEKNMGKDLLLEINKNGIVNSLDYSNKVNLSHQKIVGTIKSIEALGNIIEVEQITKKSWVLTDEGQNVCNDGSLEAKLFHFIPAEGIDIAIIKSSILFQNNSSIALGQALKQKWIKKNQNLVTKNMDSIIDKTQNDLILIKNGKTFPDNVANDYKKRQLISLVPLTIFLVKKGIEFTLSIKKQETELTKDMIESGSWKTTTFKPFNFEAKGKVERAGYLHPLMQLRSEFRKVFMQMGFTEMATSQYVENAFWNFDALFQPQKHPARDAQDTFYISNPETSTTFPMDYLERVKKVHSLGNYGSTGYRSPWNFDETKKNLLRTHTTAASARLLHRIAREGFKPMKYFSIDKVYRNETLDATHLAEFYQVEGVMGDYNLNMKDLMGTLSIFFKKIGITDLRFKPTYNPYTEPSMEMYSYHKGLKKWVEVGNSGLFRPEMLRTMGLPEEARVAGWGLSLERPAMIMYGINNIRELVGSKIKMELIFDNPVCTLDKYDRKSKNNSAFEAIICRQHFILKRLTNMNQKVSELMQETSPNNKIFYLTDKFAKGFDMTIFADPSNQPRSIVGLLSALTASVPVSISAHKHSTCGDLPTSQINICEILDRKYSTNNYSDFKMKIVWRKPVPKSPFSTVALISSVKINGEVNVCRFLARCIESLDTSIELYEKFDSCTVSKINYYLDHVQSLEKNPQNSGIKILLENVEKSLSKGKYLCGNTISLADYVAVSLLQNGEHLSKIGLKNWMTACKMDHNAKYIFC